MKEVHLSVVLLALPMLLPLDGPIPGSASASCPQSACSCDWHGGLVEVTSCGANFPLEENISVTAGPGTLHGICQGEVFPCSVFFNCYGTVVITAMSNAFTAFDNAPGQPDTPPEGTKTVRRSLPGCGLTNEGPLYSIINSEGTSLCLIRFSSWCDSCF